MTLSHQCPHLHTVNLSRCTGITDVGMRALSQGCPHLHSVNLRDCTSITNAGVVAFSEGCADLHTLDLSGCRDISDASMVALSRGCPYLHTVNLSGCQGLTNAGMTEGCACLHTVNISGCNRIVDELIVVLSRRRARFIRDWNLRQLSGSILPLYMHRSVLKDEGLLKDLYEGALTAPPNPDKVTTRPDMLYRWECHLMTGQGNSMPCFIILEIKTVEKEQVLSHITGRSRQGMQQCGIGL
jgi:hypothetical protein